MKEDLDSAARYRQRAEELRTIADTLKDGDPKRSLLVLAADYERMAESREQIDRIERERQRDQQRAPASRSASRRGSGSRDSNR